MNNFGIFFSSSIKAVFVISLCGYFYLTACQAMNNAAFADLEKQRWTLEEIDGQEALAKSSAGGMGELGKPYIEFDFAKNLFSGMASCNLITGKVKATGSEIKFLWETSTAMGCKESLMKQERDFMALLPKITRFELSEHALRLYAEDRLVLKFFGTKKESSGTNLKTDLMVESGCATTLFNNQKRAVENQMPTDLKLETPKWVLTAMAGMPLPNIETEIFINFDKTTWSVSGSSGCDSFRGGYKTGDNRINIDTYHHLVKLIMCRHQERLAVQQKFLESIQKVSRYEIKARKLNLYDEKDKLLLTFEAREKSLN